MAKRSRTMYHGIPIIITEKSGIRWGREPDARNRCIGAELRGRSFGDRQEQIQAFRDAVQECT